MDKLTIRLGVLIGLALASLSAGALTCTSVATTQTDWNKTNAWNAACGGQPPVGATVIIANGTNILVDANNSPIVADITVNAGGTLAIKSGNILSLSGNFTNNGTFTAPAGSTVAFTGTNQTISGNVTFANLQLAATTVLNLTGNITVTGTITGTLSLASTCPSNFTVTNGAGVVVAQSCPLPLPVAEYRFDETASGIVADSSGNGLSGSLNGGVAGGGVGKVCSSYNFNGTNAFVSVPHNALLNLPKVSVAAWVRHSGATMKSWETILAKGDTTYRLHLNGGCSINTPNTPYGLSFGINSGCNTADADSGIVPVANRWYHVVGTYDGTTTSIYVDGALKVSGAYAGAIGNNTLPLYIGENAQMPGRFWSGDIDEVKIYSSALTSAQVGTIYANENGGKNWDGTVRNCSGLTHVAISAPPAGMAFTAESVVITPHTAAHAAVAGAGTVALSTSTGLGDWSIGTGTGTLTPGAANSGLATYTFGAGESAATLGFTYQTAGTVILGVKDTAGIDLLLNTPPVEKANTITFTVPSFVFTNGSCVGGIAFGAAGQTCTLATWPSQIAGINSAGVYITAVNATGIPTRLSRRNVRTRNMQFGLSCHDPVANAGKQATFAGVILPLCQANGATPATWSATTAVVTFNAGVPSSSVPYVFNYPDVGKVRLWMQNSATPTQVGVSGVFVVAPHHFVFSGVTAAPIKAGNNFAATVTAYNGLATPTVTANFGKEIVPEGVTLSFTKCQPAGASTSNGTFSGSAGAFTNGVASANNLSWSEVGNGDLVATLASGNYLGGGLTATGNTGTAGMVCNGGGAGNVGRFIPDHFDTEVVLASGFPLACPTNVPGFSCPATYNGMVYSGQPFSVKVMAKNLAGGTTVNYVGTFAKAVTLTAWGALGGTTNPGGGATANGTWANGAVAAAAFTTGVATAATPSYAFTTVPTSPTDIYVRATDADNVSSLRTASVEGGVKVVSGRIKLSNAYGSERLPLTLTANAQYYASAASGWLNSLTDGATSLTLAATYDVMKNGSKTGATAASRNPATGLTAGKLTITLAPPGGATGTATVTPTVVGCAIPATCYLPVTSGTATFGVYKGGNDYIYRGESY